MARVQAILNRGYGKLSIGTRVEIIDAYDDKQSVCQTRNKPSYKLREQGFSEDGMILIPNDHLTLCRSMSDEIPADHRSNRRKGMPRKQAV